jgi:hypothetical protein
MNRWMGFFGFGLLFLVSFSTANAAQPASSGTQNYSCSFDSNGNVAPGTDEGVHVGGIFTLTIRGASITGSNAILSVDDGGDGPAVCEYQGGKGAIATAKRGADSASLSYESDGSNSTLCPSGSATLSLLRGSDGMTFVYSNESGFSGSGTCAIAGAPEPSQFSCKYDIKNAVGTGSGVGGIVIYPPLNQAVQPGKQRSAVGIVIADNYSSPHLVCPYFGAGGIANYPLPNMPNMGEWTLTGKSFPGCPASPFFDVHFETAGNTIKITAPGISNPVCISIHL